MDTCLFFFFFGKNGILYLSKLNVITSSETDRNRVSRHCFRLLSMRDIYLSKYREKRFFFPFFASVWTNPDTPERCFSAVLPAWRIEIYDRRVIERHERLKRSRAMRKSHASNTCFDANNTSTEKGCTSPKILLVNRDLISKIISWYNCVIIERNSYTSEGDYWKYREIQMTCARMRDFNIPICSFRVIPFPTSPS